MSINERVKIQRQVLYLWVSQNKSHPLTCFISNVDKNKLWHHKLGHLNLKSMKKIISEDVIKGFPKIKIKEGKISRKFQIEKQTMMSHEKLQHLATSKVIVTSYGSDETYSSRNPTWENICICVCG